MSNHPGLYRRRAVEAQNIMHGRTRVAPPPSWTATNVLLAVFVGAGITFASLASYARTVTAPGIVETTRGMPILSAKRSGILELQVQLGDTVQAGDVIAITRIDSRNELGLLGTQRSAASLEEARSAELQAQAAGQAGQSRAAARRAEAEAAGHRIESLTRQLVQARERTARAESDLSRATAIASRGFLSRQDLDSKEAAVSERRQAEASIEEQIARTRGERDVALAEARQAIDEARISSSAAAIDASRARRSAVADDALESVVHVASVSGKVASLPLRDGSQIEAGDTIAVLVPEGSHHIARISVPARLMTELDAGQRVRIAIDAYPYQTFGMINSTIQTVARAPVQTRSGPMFIVEADLPAKLPFYGKEADLLPGMTLSARIRTKERTLVEWLFDPLYAVWRR